MSLVQKGDHAWSAHDSFSMKFAQVGNLQICTGFGSCFVFIFSFSIRRVGDYYSNRVQIPRYVWKKSILQWSNPLILGLWFVRGYGRIPCIKLEIYIAEAWWHQLIPNWLNFNNNVRFKYRELSCVNTQKKFFMTFSNPIRFK